MSVYKGYRGKRVADYNIYFLYVSLAFLVIATAVYLFLPYARFLAIFLYGIGIYSFIVYLLGLVPTYVTFGTTAYYLQRILLLGFILWLLSFIVVEIIIAANSKTSRDSDNADYLVVLGAGLYGSTPSPTLKSRLDSAVLYSYANPNTTIIVSGGQGEGEDITEAEAMREYLVAHGIPSDRILEENESTSTLENLRYSFSIIDQDFKGGEEPKIAVISNEFHLYRTGLIAKRENRPVYLISARTPMFYLKATYCIREYFALFKTVFIDG